jgi:hypothetical protein
LKCVFLTTEMSTKGHVAIRVSRLMY